MQLQRYFDGTLRPIAPHVDDIVTTSDGQQLRRGDALVDSRGEYHATEEDVDYAEEEYREEIAERVHDVIDEHCRWTEEYTEHDDYGDGYAYCAFEGCDPGDIIDGVTEYIEEWAGEELKEGEARKIATDIVDRLGDCDIECEYYNIEYAAWDGNGVSVWSMAVGECEDQIEVKEHEALAELTDAELEAALASYRGDACLYEHTCYDKATGRRVGTGYVSRGTITYHTCPGGAWHYYIPGSYIKDRVEEYLEGRE